MIRRTHFVSMTLALALVGTTLGCGSKTEKKPAASTGKATWLLASMPAGSQHIHEAKPQAKAGDEVVVRGRIGGRKQPITAGSGTFTLMDLAVPSCSDNPEDNCSTPWDYCCEKPEDIMAASVTVTLVGEDGKPLSTDLAQQGLKPLDEVVVVGKVAERPNDAVMVIHAKGVHKVGS